MKRRVVLVGLLLGSLSACTIGADVLTVTQANLRVAEAVSQTVTTTIKSLEANAELDINFSMAEFVDNEVEPTSETSVDLLASLSFKGKDIDKATAQFAVEADGEVEIVSPDFEVEVEGSAEAGLYYVEDWMYADVYVAEGEDVMDLKLKSEVGPFEPITQPLEEDVDLEILEEALNGLYGVEFSERNGILTVSYQINQDDLAPLMMMMVDDELVEELTSEEIQDLIDEYDEMIAEVLELRTAKLELDINSAGLISRLEVDVDFDLELYEQWEDYDYDLEDYVLVDHIVRLQFDATFTFNLAINGSVNIEFPDFTEYGEDI